MNELNAWNVTKIEKIEDDKKKYIADKGIEKINKLKKKFANVRRQQKFQEWLNTYTDKDIPIYKIIASLCKEVLETVSNSGHVISNEKILRDEIASFIYKYCSDYA